MKVVSIQSPDYDNDAPLPDGATVLDALYTATDSRDTDRYRVRVNGERVTNFDSVLSQGDHVSIAPAKMDGAGA